MSKKILIADDDSSIISILTYALDSKGYEIVTSGDGEETRTLAFSAKPDLIVLDVLMPKVDGFTLLKEFRASNELKDTPVIIISGVYKTYSIIQNTMRDLKATDYFKKPFDLEALVERVQTLCPTAVKKEKVSTEKRGISKYLFVEKIPASNEFSIIPVYKVFSTLFNHKKSGLLTLTDKSVVKKILIKDGSPIEVSSNIAGEWLGRLLVREKAITAEQYKETLELMGKVKKRHGEILLEKKLLTPSELYNYLKMQLIEKIINTFSWSEGVYKFAEDEQLDRVSPKTVNTCRIVLNGIKSKVDIDFIKKELSEINGNSVFAIKNRDTLFSSFGFSGAETKLIRSFDGSKKLSLIKDDAKNKEDDFSSLFYTLLLFNSLKLIGEVSGQYEKIEKASKFVEKPTAPLTDEERKAVDKISDIYDKLSEMNYYELFNISEDSESSEIKKAYFKLAKDLHPDKFADSKFEEVRGRASKVFSEIASAYQTLSNEEEKEKYDKRLKDGEAAGEDEQLKQAHDILTAEMQFQKGVAYLNSRDYDNAHDAFGWALKLNPKEAEYHLYKAIAIFKDPREKSAESRLEAKKIIGDVISMNANLEEAHYYLGLIYKLDNDHDAAEKQFRTTIQLKKDHVEANRELRLMQMRKEKKKGFIKGFFK